MQRETKRIGISGGTFDPIHHGHLIVSEMIKEEYNLDKVIFIPSGFPPHKKVMEVTSAEHRYNMLCGATASNTGFEVSRIEIDREGYTYSIDTLMQLSKIYGNEYKLYFMIGADVIFDLLTWKDYERVFGMCEFIAALRPGFRKDDFVSEIEKLKLNYNAKISVAEIPQIEISSTGIRERIRNEKSIKYLVPGSVERYIVEHGLYQV